MDFKAIEEKWQKRYEEAKAFEPSVEPGRPKYFITYPYPYMNGYFHIGRAFSGLRAEVLARYKLMQGYNVLFPFAFHCTGTPIVAAAERIAEGEKKQMDILKKAGIPEEEIPKFADPVYWTEYFSRTTKEDLKKVGAAIDWSRSFRTTALNPHYDRFIKWQFRKLKEGGYVVMGEHPVVWCPRCKSPVGDHARLEGEGVTPEEIFLIKFKLGEAILPCGTYRPETSFGVTNLWLNPEVTYVRAKVNDEEWLVSEETVEKLANQKYVVTVIEKVKGKDLIGKKVLNQITGREVPILPAVFVEPGRGTGVVMSVPAHAPYDYAALRDIESSPADFGISPDIIKDIRLIPLITIEGFGKFPAKEIIEQMNIKDQNDPRLEDATKEIYKKEFHTGVLNENCGKYAGSKVMEAKLELESDFVHSDMAAIFYELPQQVVCRCLTKCVVKIVSDQWFLNYSNPIWKAQAHKALDAMTLYPEKVRKQFDYVLDWLKDWACTREYGLGTELPWDKRWMIESLSDSTIYMSYYTISKFLQDPHYGIKPEQLTDEFFDFVLLDKGTVEDVSKKTGIMQGLIMKMKQEFEYWYPFDMRCSGKDLVQNHLSFCIFNHTAIFPEKYWPQGMGVNGFLQLDGQKMSSSKGNIYTLRQVTEMYGADATRLTLMYGGEGLEDPNWDSEFARTAGPKLAQWYDFALENYGRGRDDEKYIDLWLESVATKTIKLTKEAMDTMDFRTAIQRGYFDMQRYLRWYIRRSPVPNKRIISWFIDVQTRILAPFTPHMCEEIWQQIGGQGFIAKTPYPTWDEKMIANETIERSEDFIRKVIEDAQEIITVANLTEAKEAYIYTSDDWKYKALQIAAGKNMGDAMKAVMADEDMRKHGKEVSRYIQKIISERLVPSGVDEPAILKEAQEFIAGEIGMKVSVNAEFDPQNKKKHAIPGRPAIFIQS
ncbi:leucyl-tRNA synthetase [Methanocella paludicola SANAE]|uniref:Leucine--tRNA ligase n=1 Tax=Methanocella paludicola (strain DSM 17711 / JCM 13418 / NBRC 101707 / SANAE) TaxID=304371 RepID=D1YZH1_METPS|nr:leucine--tRNA ligase [Methanocella paludicola]BAI61843.1 leucyl-tRNA synthetase [Methanocella paludicola SANAE]